MSNNFTPGEWVVLHDHRGWWVGATNPLDKHCYGEVANVQPGLFAEQTEANLKLIAAAPELLSALRGCVDMLSEDAKMLRTTGNPGHAAMSERFISIARSAIEKAVGDEK